MNKNFLVSIATALILTFILGSCGKKITVDSPVLTSSGSSTQEPTPVANHQTKAPTLGLAKQFGLMAYVSIASSQQSSISGKVGLKPGVRSLLGLSATEVSGGLADIYAGDDSGEAQNYLTMAREDLVAAYKEVYAREADKDKVGAYRGDISGKTLPPGTYRFSNGLAVASDVILEGEENDVWIFQVDGDINLAANTHISLSGGAQAKNVYWQASGRVILGSGSQASGTFMNQLTAELKQGAQVVGRVLCKNGKVLLTGATITKPE